MGEAGAYRMLLFAADQPVLPVDARISRVARRLGYGEAAQGFHEDRAIGSRSPVRAAPARAAVYRRTFLYLNHHGAATCTETDPHCPVCPLLEECPEGRKRRVRQ